MKTSLDYMRLALRQADKAEAIDEVPVGCVIVKDNKVIASAYNQKESKNDCTCHAEILAIKKASKKLNNWRLIDCDMYVTLEPCVMCSGAIISSRIKNLYFGAYDPKSGAFGSSINVQETQQLNHTVNIYSGILEEECSQKIKNYFRRKR